LQVNGSYDEDQIIFPKNLWLMSFQFASSQAVRLSLAQARLN